MTYLIGSIIVFIVIIAIWLIVFYNKMVDRRTKAENSWGQIDVQLKMRADLVPNLVETVGAYAKHEKETLANVAEARAKLMSSETPADVMKSSGELNGLIGRLLAISEQYPDLKANQGFVQLQNQLDELEKKIAMYRQFYNDTVLIYNRLISTFPNNIAAAILGSGLLPYFKIDDSERSAPKVKF